MTIPLEAWDVFRDEMNPYIEKAFNKEITFEEFHEIFQQKLKQLHEKYDNQKVLIGWLGGDYDHLGFYDNKKDAERGHLPNERLYDLIDEKFKGRKVKITLEIIE